MSKTLTAINLDEYYSAGYFLIRKNKRPFWLGEPAGLVPNELISLAPQFCPKLHLNWGWGSNQHNERTNALNLGIDESKWAEFEQWCTDFGNHEMEVWSMFHSTDAVRRFVKTFIPDSKWDGLMIVGAGWHQFCEIPWKPSPDSQGVPLRILAHVPMETGGEVLGFEVANHDYNDFDHSWFSHGHHRGVFEEFGIRPGNFGLLQTREEAARVRDYANEHDQYEHYEYWLLVAYPLT